MILLNFYLTPFNRYNYCDDTSGNAGIAFGVLCRYQGFNLKCVDLQIESCDLGSLFAKTSIPRNIPDTRLK